MKYDIENFSIILKYDFISSFFVIHISNTYYLT